MNKKFITIPRIILLLTIVIGFIINKSYKLWPKIKDWQVPDNDDAMRVLEVRSWLQGQGFYDIINHRLNPPNGGDIHWSRIGDLPLAFMELILRPFMGADIGEKFATFITPLMLGVVFAIMAGLCVARFSKNYISLLIGAILAVLTAGVMSYFQAGRVDHHGLQIIFALLGLWGLLANNKSGAIIAGIAIAASITIGFETIIIVALMIIWVAIVWGVRGNKEVTLPFTLSLAVSTIIGFLINVPPSEFAIVQNDALSIAQLFPILGGCIGLFIASVFFSYTTISARFIALFVIGLIVVVIATQFPILLEKPYYQTSSLLQKLWLGNVSETRPLIKSRVAVQIILGMFEILASIAVFIKITYVIRDKRREDYELENWLLLGGILISLTLLASFWQLRVAGMAQTFAIIAAGALFVTTIDKSTNSNSLANALIILLVVNPMIPVITSELYEKARPEKTKFAVGGGETCRGTKAFAHLAALPEGLIASHIDFGAQALLTTHHKVLAAPYHRNQGNTTAYQILLAPPEQSLQLIKNAGVDYVGICTKSAETAIISRQSPNGLMKHLVDKKYPDYLELVPTPQNSGIIIWKVKK